MTFDWETHKPLIRRLYIDEGRTLEDIQDLMKTVHDFAPSRRSWQQHFTKWGFKKNHKLQCDDERLINRVKELWANNLPHAEMLKVLNEEDGFSLSSRDLAYIRSKNGCSLRASKASISAANTTGSEEQLAQHQDDENVSDQNVLSRQIEPDNEPQSEKRGRARYSKKPDGSSSRFPSEMTIEEARLILSLDNAQYDQVAANFRRRCEQNGILKKSSAPSEVWEMIKTDLITDVPQLQKVLVRFPDNMEMKNLALEVLCSNVTKRMRVATRKMSLPEAKNVLGVNPVEARLMREALWQVLQDAKCNSKSDLKPTEWEELKRQWGQKCEAVQRALAMNPEDPNHEKTRRALEVLAKNVIGRLQLAQKQTGQYNPRPRNRPPTVPLSQPPAVSSAPDDSNTPMPDTEPSGLMGSHQTQPGSDIAYGTIVSHQPTTGQRQSRDRYPPASGIGRGADRLPVHPSQVVMPTVMGASTPSHHNTPLMSNRQAHPPVIHADSQQHFIFSTAPPAYQEPQPAPLASIAAYFRLHPTSTFATETNIWIAAVNSPLLMDVRKAVSDRYPNAFCARIEGLVKDGMGGELPLRIEDDEELRAYLSHVQGAAPTFSVQLGWKQP